MSDRQPQQSQSWLYSHRLQKWYWHDSSTNQYVFQDGALMPAPVTQPRSGAIPIPQQGGTQYVQNASQSPFQYPSPTQHQNYLTQPGQAHYPTSNQQMPNQHQTQQASESSHGLASSFQDMSIEGVQVPASTSQNYQRGGIDMITTSNLQAGVRTTIGTYPQERFTDPILLGRGIRAHRILVGTEGEEERLYPLFRLQRPEFFVVGRVFHILWAEPAGETRTLVTKVEASRRTDPALLRGRHNESVYSKVRRFVVVRAGDQFCSALPVMSYGHRGVGKPGVNKHEHAIIHTGSDAPQPLPDESPRRGELPMRPETIRVVADNPTEKLDPESRIDFLRVHSVQYNIKAKSFGMVHPHSMAALVNVFSSVWLMSLNPSLLAPSAPQQSSISQATGETGSRRGVNQKRDDNNDDDDNDDNEDNEDSEEDNREDNEEDNEEEEENEDDDDNDNDDTRCAQQANDAIERFRTQGYNSEHAFVIVMGKLQSDRNLTRDEAYRLLCGWTGFRLTENRSVGSTRSVSGVTRVSGSASQQTVRQNAQQPASQQSTSQNIQPASRSHRSQQQGDSARRHRRDSD